MTLLADTFPYELARAYAFGTLAAAARAQHDEPDEHDVEPDAAEPGSDPGPMPTPAMADGCGYEICRNWAGSGCVCDVLDLEPDIVEEDPVNDERTAEHDDPGEAEALALLTPTLAGWREAFGRFLVQHDVDDPDDLLAEFDRVIAKHDTEERQRVAKAIEALPTTWPNGVKHSAAWMRHEAAAIARARA